MTQTTHPPAPGSDHETSDRASVDTPKETRSVGVIVSAAVLLAAAFLIGAFMAGRATSSSVAEVGSQQITAPSQDPNPAPPILADGEEPVADVAAALAPSVVQLETGIGLGSGVIYHSDGLILTAAHVVEGAERVSVVMLDGTRVEGTVVGADPASDIAVVRVGQTDLPAAPLALDEDLQVGQMAVAIGSPFGLNGTVTAGIVSAIAEPIPGPDGRIRTMIQTDAPINPGNSGGALADRRGRVIGINDAIFSLSGGNDGIGFAIPIDTAAASAERIVAGEPLGTAFLGITGTEPSLGRAGALVTGVLPDSAATTAGLQVGDLIVSYDRTPVESFAALAGLVHGSQPGDEISLGVVRGDQELTLSVTLGEQS